MAGPATRSSDSKVLLHAPPQVLATQAVIAFALLVPTFLIFAIASSLPVFGLLCRFGWPAPREPCRLRERDELHDICKLLNEAAAAMRAAQTAPTESSESGRAASGSQRGVTRDQGSHLASTKARPHPLLPSIAPKYAGIGRPRCRGKRLPSPEVRAKSTRGWTQLEPRLYGRKTRLQVKTRTCFWYTATGQRLVRVVLTRDPKGNEPGRAFISTDHELTPEAILGHYARRWLIEVSFRDAKQHLG